MFHVGEEAGRKSARLDGGFGDNGIGAGVGATGRLGGSVTPQELGQQVGLQLLASLTDSTDPLSDASDALAYAHLWLNNMRRLGLVGSPASTLASPSLNPILGGSNLLGSQLGGSSLGLLQNALASQVANAEALNMSQVIYAQDRHHEKQHDRHYDRNYDRHHLDERHQQRFKRDQQTRGQGQSQGQSQGRIKSAAGVKFEDWKERTSDFLREYGDPGAVNGGSRPVPGENGNWACENCSNTNFPRRQNCLRCHTPRSEKAEQIVREYVKTIIDAYNT